MLKVNKTDKKNASPAKADKANAGKVKKVAKKPTQAKQIKEKIDAKVKKVVKDGLVEAPPAGSPDIGSPKVAKVMDEEKLAALRQKKKDKKLENKLKKRAVKSWIKEEKSKNANEDGEEGDAESAGKGKPKKKSKGKVSENGEETGNESKRAPIKPKQTVFVGNLPTNTKRVQLTKLFSKFGTIVCIRFRTASGKVIFKHKARKESNSLNANIAFDSEESAVKALEMNNFEFKGNHIRVTATSEEDIAKDPKRTIVVGNLKYTATDDKLRQIFSSCGEIEYVRCIQNGEKGCNGVGFVCFKNPDAVGLAMELKGTVLDERPINVERYTVHKSGAMAKRDKEEGPKKGPGSNKFPKKAAGNKPPGPGKNKKNFGKGGNKPAGAGGDPKKRDGGKPGKKFGGGAKNQKASDAGDVAKKGGADSKKNKSEFRGVKSTIVKKGKGKKIPSAMKKLAKKIAPKGDD